MMKLFRTLTIIAALAFLVVPIGAATSGRFDLRFDTTPKSTALPGSLDVEFTAWRDGGNESKVLADVATDLPGRYVILFEKNVESSAVSLTTFDSSGFREEISLDDSSFEVKYYDTDTIHTLSWVLDPAEGGLLHQLDSYNATGSVNGQFEMGGPFWRYPLHRLTLSVMKQVGTDLVDERTVARLWSASRALAGSISAKSSEGMHEWDGWELQLEKARGGLIIEAEYLKSDLAEDHQESVQQILDIFHELAPDAGGPGVPFKELSKSLPPPVCTMPNAGSAETANTQLTGLPVTASLTAASAQLACNCDRLGGLNQSSVGGSILLGSSQGGTSPCPIRTPDYELNPSFYAFALVYPGVGWCCPNGPLDTARSSDARLSFAGAVLDVHGNAASGDCVNAYGNLSGTVRVCWDLRANGEIKNVSIVSHLNSQATCTGSIFNLP